ncbi:MAG: hypothetical protein ACJ797_09120 [Ktedonobacteraceae bacterium]
MAAGEQGRGSDETHGEEEQGPRVAWEAARERSQIGDADEGIIRAEGDKQRLPASCVRRQGMKPLPRACIEAWRAARIGDEAKILSSMPATLW